MHITQKEDILAKRKEKIKRIEWDIFIKKKKEKEKDAPPHVNQLAIGFPAYVIRNKTEQTWGSALTQLR